MSLGFDFSRLGLSLPRDLGLEQALRQALGRRLTLTISREQVEEDLAEAEATEVRSPDDYPETHEISDDSSEALDGARGLSATDFEPAEPRPAFHQVPRRARPRVAFRIGADFRVTDHKPQMTWFFWTRKLVALAIARHLEETTRSSAEGFRLERPGDWRRIPAIRGEKQVAELVLVVLSEAEEMQALRQRTDLRASPRERSFGIGLPGGDTLIVGHPGPRRASTLVRVEGPREGSATHPDFRIDEQFNVERRPGPEGTEDGSDAGVEDQDKWEPAFRESLAANVARRLRVGGGDGEGLIGAIRKMLDVAPEYKLFRARWHAQSREIKERFAVWLPCGDVVAVEALVTPAGSKRAMRAAALRIHCQGGAARDGVKLAGEAWTARDWRNFAKACNKRQAEGKKGPRANGREGTAG